MTMRKKMTILIVATGIYLSLEHNHQNLVSVASTATLQYASEN